MRSVFWADGRSRSSYLSFGDVVVFDVTYKTNHLSLPFAPFTGVNHHRQSILFGCALLADEQEDTFIWLFTQWLKCMHGVAPKAIITDQDAQIGGAIKQWYRASTIHACEERWKILKEKFNIDENIDSWLIRMYRLRAHWVDAYLKDMFWAGMTTSQRSESINAFSDGYVNTKTRLVDFVCQYDKALANRRASESREDFMTLNIVPAMLLRHPIEVQVSKLYTRGIFKMFQDELTNGLSLFHEEMLKEETKIIYLVGDFSEEREKWEEVTYDKSRELKFKCSCALFETDGILCRHILHIIWLLQLTAIPDNYILHR
ncbi:protein FAR1-RELATED SEQUENCE 5-like [Asparagus officinalis]|uniref:protein FAR1-RELATED SEQUENCE 5-like n=1 Tax=Asparagus officinalis TaxID=4686 RepID=UPI00098E71AE|nr:protein FAR1-RELATED SEQUENCE 5-like [Asparagus officinalis]